MPEIDETELANLRRMALVAERVSKHPEGRALLQKAVAIAIPEEAGPEIRLRQEMDEKFTGLQNTLNEFIAGQTKRQEEQQAETAKQSFQRQWSEGRSYATNAGWTEDGLKQLEEFMEREGIANHKHAIAAFERENPQPPPVLTGNQGFSWNTGNDETHKAAIEALWKGDENKFLETMIPAAIAEVRGR